jgi:hypothetical protein
VVRLLLVALVGGASCAAPAFSQDAPSTKLYVSADIGNASNGVSQYVYGTPVPPRDEKSAVFRVRAGYQFVRFFALEAGFADLGSYGANVHMDCSVSPQVTCIPDFESEIEMRAFTTSGVAMYTFGDRLSVRAAVGLYLREKKTRQVPLGAPAHSRSSHAVLGSFGFGAGYAVTKKLDVYLEWNKFQGEDPGYGDGTPSPPGSIADEADLEAFSLGARWRF